MKLIYCLECADIFSPGIEKPARCKCGYSVAKWSDAARGILQVASRATQNHVRVLGINNAWLRAATTLPDGTDEADILHRHQNERTSEAADGYLFKSRNCPLVMMRAPSGTQIYYVKELLSEIPWRGKFDCADKE